MSAAMSSWSGNASCSCSLGRSSGNTRAVRGLGAVPAAMRHTSCGASPRGGAAVLEREEAQARRVEEVQPTSFELFTTTDDAWAREFAEFASATQTMDDLAALQQELMSTVASMDSLLLTPLPTAAAPSKGSSSALDPEARRAKRQQSRAARKRSPASSSAPAASPVAAAATLVLEPPPVVHFQRGTAAIPQRPPPQQQQPEQQEQEQQQVEQQQHESQQPALAPARRRTAAAAPSGTAPASAAAAVSPPPAPRLALGQPTQHAAAATSLSLPTIPAPARATHQARASRNSAGRSALSKRSGDAAKAQASVSDTAMSGDSTAQFFKMTSSVGVLKPEQQKEVAAVVKDYLSLKSIEKELVGILKRPPTVAEWAKAVKMEPMAFQARLRRGQEAKALMLKSNYRLVVKVVKAYQNRGLSLQDLITEGMQGLIKGVEKFEADKGFRFSTYAHWWIRQAVTRAVQEQGRAVRLPTHLHEQIGRVTMAMAQLQKKLGRAPTMAEVGKEVDLPADRVAEILAAARPSSSLEVAAVGSEDDGAAEAKDQLADDRAQPDEVMEDDNVAASVDAALSQALTPREAGILRMHWGLDGRGEMTLEEIGAHFGVTRERVRQVEARAMRKLKESQLALTAGVLGELQGMSVHSSDGAAARASRGTKKT